MNDISSIQEIFFKYLSIYNFKEESLDYSIVDKHIKTLQSISEIGNSGTGIFDLSKKEVIFYSSNFGKLLGYSFTDYESSGQDFFAKKIHTIG